MTTTGLLVGWSIIVALMSAVGFFAYYTVHHLVAGLVAGLPSTINGF